MKIEFTVSGTVSSLMTLKKENEFLNLEIPIN